MKLTWGPGGALSRGVLCDTREGGILWRGKLMDKVKPSDSGLPEEADGAPRRKKHPWEPPRVTGTALSVKNTNKPHHTDEQSDDGGPGSPGGPS